MGMSSPSILTGDMGGLPGGGPQLLLTTWGPMPPILVKWGAFWSLVDIGVQRVWMPASWGSAHLTGKNLGSIVLLWFGVMCGCRPPRPAMAG